MSEIHEKITSFHNEKVTLPREEQDKMRRQRNVNRERLNNSDPKPDRVKSQGSYAMHTMVQQPDNDYDIDDGVYFEKENIEDHTPKSIKKNVCDALKDGKFKRSPKVCKKCVRVYYNEGYHVDMPIYREIGKDQYELAGDEGWEKSDPSAVTKWFLEENEKQSPDTNNGRQLRRVTRLLKAFVRSREDWRDKISTGFMISKLVVDHYKPADSRDDKALRDTMIAIRDALSQSLEIDHPTLDGKKITDGLNDSKTKFFFEKLSHALKELDDTSNELEAWNRVFDTDFFCEEPDDDEPSSSDPDGTDPLVTESEPRNPVSKGGGGRYA